MLSSSREVMQRAGDVQSSLAKELAEYEMQVEKDVLAPMASLLEVILYYCVIVSVTYNLEIVCAIGLVLHSVTFFMALFKGYMYV